MSQFEDAVAALQILAIDGAGYSGFVDSQIVADFPQGQGLQVLTAIVEERPLMSDDSFRYIIYSLLPLVDTPNQPQGGIDSF